MADIVVIGQHTAINLDRFSHAGHFSGQIRWCFDDGSQLAPDDTMHRQFCALIKNRQAGPMHVAADWLQTHGFEDAAAALRKEFTP